MYVYFFLYVTVNNNNIVEHVGIKQLEIPYST